MSLKMADHRMAGILLCFVTRWAVSSGNFYSTLEHVDFLMENSCNKNFEGFLFLDESSKSFANILAYVITFLKLYLKIDLNVNRQMSEA